MASSPQTAGYTGRYFEGRRTPNRLSARELDPHIQDRAWTLGAELMRPPRPTTIAKRAEKEASAQ